MGTDLDSDQDWHSGSSTFVVRSESFFNGRGCTGDRGSVEQTAVATALCPSQIASGRLTVTLTYGPLFWGAVRIDSGLAAVINLSLIPIGLIAAEAVLKKHRPVRSQLIACIIGLPGLAILFWGSSGDARFEGILAVIVGTVAYCIGSVLSRRIPTQPAAITVSAVCNTIGALLLGVWAIATGEKLISLMGRR